MIVDIQNEEKVLRENEDKIGNVLLIDGGTLVFFGTLKVKYCVIVNDGTLIVSNKFFCERELVTKQADISMGECELGNVQAEDTSIFCAGSMFCNKVEGISTDILTRSMQVSNNIEMPGCQLEVFGNLEAENIVAKDIVVHGDTWVKDVSCSNYLVDGKNESHKVEAENIYILDQNVSFDLTAAEIFLGSDADLYHHCIQATHHFEVAGKVKNCGGFKGVVYHNSK